jgi:hypothetical protein
MRHVYCQAHAERWRLGTYEVMPAGAIYEPAEWARVVYGGAKRPTFTQRTARLNGVPSLLAQGHYDCDLCAAPIAPGDFALCVTVWIPDHGPEPIPWEHEYLDADTTLGYRGRR